MPGDDSKAEISADSERTQQRRLKNRQATQLDNLDNNPCSKVCTSSYISVLLRCYISLEL